MSSSTVANRTTKSSAPLAIVSSTARPALLAPEGRLPVVGFTAGEISRVKVNRLLLGEHRCAGGGPARVLRTAARCLMVIALQ
jgi:hypothetical protein